MIEDLLNSVHPKVHRQIGTYVSAQGARIPAGGSLYAGSTKLDPKRQLPPDDLLELKPPHGHNDKLTASLIQRFPGDWLKAKVPSGKKDLKTGYATTQKVLAGVWYVHLPGHVPAAAGGRAGRRRERR